MNPIVTGIIGVVGSIIDKVIPDKAKAEQAKLELALREQEIQAALATKQIEVNVEEAKHPSIFVSGARPFILWVCGIAFAYHFVLYPIVKLIMVSSGHDINFPVFDMESLMTVLGGLLGLGTLRTYEKIKGVTK